MHSVIRLEVDDLALVKSLRISYCPAGIWDQDSRAIGMVLFSFASFPSHSAARDLRSVKAPSYAD
jgi:hypothetical protein